MWTSLARFWRKLAFQFQRDRFHREMAEELALHAELKQREHAAAGLSAGEAAARARRDMGNLTLALDESHDARSFVSWEHLIQDIRYAVRVLLKSPGFSLVAIGSLALGIAGNTAVFSILNALLIKPLPFGDPDRLVRITEFYPRALLIYFQDRSETMDVASVNPGSEINVTGQGPAFRITASATSANLFSVLRVPAERGRVFEPGEDQKGRSDVVILSHQLWSTRFRSDPDIVGRLIMLDGRPRRIVGVMPASFVFPSRRVQLWLPAALDPADMETYWGRDFVPLIGRLRPGVTLDRAKAEVRALAVGIWTMFPFPMPRNFNANATVISLQRDLAGDSRGRLILLLCAVGIVLVIACANVASLQTARATTRTREMALRAALGAGRFRIVRQLLTESIVLGAAAGAAGLALGASALELFSSVVPPALPGVARIGIDWNVAAFTVALSLVAGISFGLIPALGASRINLADAVKSRTQAAAAASSARLRNLLIAGEIALTLILVVGASLLIRSLYALSTVDPGFNTRRVLAMKISPQSSFCAEPERCIASYEGLLSAVRGLPGIVDAALANTIPMSMTPWPPKPAKSVRPGNCCFDASSPASVAPAAVTHACPTARPPASRSLQLQPES